MLAKAMRKLQSQQPLRSSLLHSCPPSHGSIVGCLAFASIKMYMEAAGRDCEGACDGTCGNTLHGTGGMMRLFGRNLGYGFAIANNDKKQAQSEDIKELIEFVASDEHSLKEKVQVLQQSIKKQISDTEFRNMNSNDYLVRKFKVNKKINLIIKSFVKENEKKIREFKEGRQNQINTEYFNIFMTTVEIIKREAMVQYNKQCYQECSGVIDHFFDNFEPAAQHLNKIITKLTHYQEQKAKLLASWNEQNTNNTNDSNPAPSTPPPLPSTTFHISAQELYYVLSYLPRVPEALQKCVLELYLSRMDQLATRVHVFFMLDAVSRRYQLTNSFVEKFQYKIDSMISHGAHYYCYLQFVNYVFESNQMTFLVRTSNVMRHRNLSKAAYSYYDIYKMARVAALEYDVAMRSCNRRYYNKFFVRILPLEKRIFSYGSNFLYAMKIYELFMGTYPITNEFISGANLPKDYRINENQLNRLRVFLKYYINNVIDVKYIFTINQFPNTSYDFETISRIRQMVQQGLDIDPEFILQTGTLFTQRAYLSQKSYNPSNEARLVTLLKNLIAQNKDELLSVPEHGDSTSNVGKIYQALHMISQVYRNSSSDTVFKGSFRDGLLDAIYSSVASSPLATITSTSVWKFLYELCYVMRRADSGEQAEDIDQKVKNIYEKFCLPYIDKALKQNREQKSVILSPKYEMQYILRIAKLLNSALLRNDPAQLERLSSFINQKFKRTAKTLKKFAVLEVLQLFNIVPNVDLEIYGHLYSNLSTFILYSHIKKKFFLRDYKPLYLKVVRDCLGKADSLKNIPNRNRLKMIRVLAESVWEELSCRQVAHLLIIFGHPMFLGEKASKLVSNLKFQESDFEGLDLSILSEYKFINKSLTKIIKKLAPELIGFSQDIEQIRISNQQDQKQLAKIFTIPEFYERAFEDSTFTNEQLIPEPLIADPHVRTIYACLKIVARLRQKYGNTLNQFIDKCQISELQKRKPNPEPLNLTPQLFYIRNNNLVQINKVNEFKLDNMESKGEYEVVESWQEYTNDAELIPIEGYNTYNQVANDSYINILKLVHGNMDIIKKITKKQLPDPEILMLLQKYNLEVTINGSLIEIDLAEQKMPKLYIMCSGARNHKFHMIIAAMLEQAGYLACQFVQGTNKNEDLVRLLKILYKDGLKERTGEAKEEKADVQEQDPEDG